jgi:Flp pilus assembly protein TadG
MRVQTHQKPKRRTGAAAVELAFVLPIFTTLVFAQIETARVGQVTQMLTIAARQGARVAVVPGKTASDVQTAVSAVLSGAKITSSTLTVSPSTWETDAGGTLITVNVSVPYSQVSWINPSRYFKMTTLTGSATMSSERP